MSRVKLLLIVGILLVLLWGIYFLFFTSSPKDPVVQHLEALKLEDINKAYSFTSQEYQKNMPFDVFQQEFGNFFANYRSVIFFDALDANVLFVSVDTAYGYTEDMQYTTVKEGLFWKINSIDFLNRAAEDDEEEFDLVSQ